MAPTLKGSCPLKDSVALAKLGYTGFGIENEKKSLCSHSPLVYVVDAIDESNEIAMMMVSQQWTMMMLVLAKRVYYYF